MVEFFLNIVEITVGVTALVLIMLLLLRLFGGKFTAKCRYILWVLVMVRLAVPFSLHMVPAFVEVPVEPVILEEKSDENPAELPFLEGDRSEMPETKAPVSTPVVISPVGGGNIYVPDASDKGEAANPQGTAAQSPVIPDSRVENDSFTPEPATETQSAVDVLSIASAVHIAGAAAFFFWNLLSYLLYTARILKKATPADGRTTEIFRSVCRKEGLTTMPRLLVSAEVSSPAAFGVFRPTVVLPAIPLSENGLTSTLSHEAVHCKRGDLAVKVIALLARSLHWFNPVVHMAAYRLETEMEMSCDEVVLSGCSDEVRVAYGNVMLDIIRRCRRNRGALTTHFNPKKSLVKSRFANIIHGSGTRKGRIVIPLCLALCLIAGAVVSCTLVGEKGKAPEGATELTEEEMLTLYRDFLTEKANAVDKDGNVINLGDCMHNDPDAAYKKYAFYDMNGDDLPELIVKTSYELDIFQIADDQVTLWYRGSNYEKPLNNGMILWERSGSAPPHTAYQSIELGADGEEVSRLSFTESKADGDEAEYFVNSVPVSEEEYKETADPIFAIGDDKITWEDLPFDDMDPIETASPLLAPTYTVEFPAGEVADGDDITVAAVYGETISYKFRFDSPQNVIEAGDDGVQYYVMGVEGETESFRTYRVTSQNGVILSVEEVPTFTKDEVLRYGVPYTGAIEGEFRCMAPDFLENSEGGYSLVSYSVRIRKDGTVSAEHGSATGIGGAEFYDGTCTYDPETGLFTAKMDGRSYLDEEVFVTDAELVGKLYEYGGFVHFVCESSELSRLNENGVIPMTFAGKTEAMETAPAETEAVITTYTVEIPLEDERDYITVAAQYGKNVMGYYPARNVLQAGEDGFQYYVMGVGSDLLSAGNFKSLRTYRVTSENGGIKSVDEVETYTKDKVLANGTPYGGPLAGMYTCHAYRFEEGNYDYNLRSHTLYLGEDGTFSALVGTGPAVIFEGTYQYHAETGDFTANLTGRYTDHVYPDVVVKGKLLALGGFVHFICEESNIFTISPDDPLPLTFVPNTDGYATPAKVMHDGVYNGTWIYSGDENLSLGLFLDTAAPSICLWDTESGRTYVGSYTVNPLTYKNTAVLRRGDDPEDDGRYTMTFSLSYSITAEGKSLYLEVHSFDAPEYGGLVSKYLSFRPATLRITDGADLPGSAEEAYDLVLQNKMLIQGYETEYLDEYLARSGHRIVKYAVLDLDGNNSPEMILLLGHGENDSVGSLVLHYANDMVTGTELWHRMMYHLKADGTYHFSGGGPNDGTGRMEFPHGVLTPIKLSYGEEGDDGSVTYYVEGQAVSEDVYWAYEAAQDEKEEPVWVEDSAS